MNLLFSLNETYVPPLKVLLSSIFYHHPHETFNIYLMHASMQEEIIEDLAYFIEERGHRFYPIYSREFFRKEDEMAITRYYTLEMYLWMFAPYILPEHVDRILYLDPDIVNMNHFSSFYHLDFQDKLFVATNYKYKTKWLQPFNNLRLRTFDSENYFNSGVVLMNIERLRKVGNPDKIIEAIHDNKRFLILPDQDIFNLLYDGSVLGEDWRIYNMNPKVYDKLKVLFPTQYNENWIEDNVVFIHYCGKHKPWVHREKYKYALGKYYYEMEKQVDGTMKEETKDKGWIG